ncbi:MAG: ClbS/DfsB family four-helix bundle protein [Pirellulaceae bacterium]
MPRPKTKTELLTASADGYDSLNAKLGSLSSAQQVASFPFKHRDKNVRDVLAHLHEWQVMMAAWYEIGMEGSKPDMPAKGYTWKTTADLNAEIWAKYQKTSLKQIGKKLDVSHDLLRKIISSHTNEELFTKCRYAWTGTTSLGSYLTSATSSHYDWSLKVLARYARTLKSGVG